MDIIDRKSEIVLSFFKGINEVVEETRRALENRTPNLNGEKLMTNKEVCRMLKVSPRTLQDWKTGGILPYIQLKGKILYRESDIGKVLSKYYSA